MTKMFHFPLVDIIIIVVVVVNIKSLKQNKLSNVQISHLMVFFILPYAIVTDIAVIKQTFKPFNLHKASVSTSFPLKYLGRLSL